MSHFVIGIRSDPSQAPTNARRVEIPGPLGTQLRRIINRERICRGRRGWIEFPLSELGLSDNRDQGQTRRPSEDTVLDRTRRRVRGEERHAAAIAVGDKLALQRSFEDNKRTVLGWPIATIPGLSAEDEPSMTALHAIATKAMEPGREMGWNMVLKRTRVRGEEAQRTTWFIVIAHLWDPEARRWMCAPDEQEIANLMEKSPFLKGRPTWEVCAEANPLSLSVTPQSPTPDADLLSHYWG